MGSNLNRPYNLCTPACMRCMRTPPYGWSVFRICANLSYCASAASLEKASPAISFDMPSYKRVSGAAASNEQNAFVPIMSPDREPIDLSPPVLDAVPDREPIDLSTTVHDGVPRRAHDSTSSSNRYAPPCVCAHNPTSYVEHAALAISGFDECICQCYRVS